MYKDKDQQRKAVREAVRRYRARQVIPCNTHKDVIPDVIPLKTKFRPEPQSYNSMMVGYVSPTGEQ